VYPIVLIYGKAQSGKDTAGRLLERRGNVQCIALADPMKRFAQEVFGFSDEMCWGSSEKRSVPINITDGNRNFDIPRNTERVVLKWLNEILSVIESNDIRRLRSCIKSLALNESLTLRKVLQEIGTGWGRKINRDIWINYAVKVAKELLYGGFAYSQNKGLYECSSQKGKELVVITDGRFRNELLKVKELNGTTINILRDTAEMPFDASKHPSETEQDTIPTSFFNHIIHNNKDIQDLESKLRNLSL